MATETKATFTPGPWKFEGDRRDAYVRMSDGRTLWWCGGPHIRGGSSRGIGSILWRATHLSPFRWLSWWAHETPGIGLGNARLIAAAPDLLAVLHECAELLDDYSDVNDGDDGQPVANKAMAMLQVVEAAIAKAEGQQ